VHADWSFYDNISLSIQILKQFPLFSPREKKKSLSAQKKTILEASGSVNQFKALQKERNVAG
jgi:hypothetical protein